MNDIVCLIHHLIDINNVSLVIRLWYTLHDKFLEIREATLHEV